MVLHATEGTDAALRPLFQGHEQPPQLVVAKGAHRLPGHVLIAELAAFRGGAGVHRLDELRVGPVGDHAVRADGWGGRRTSLATLRLPAEVLAVAELAGG